MTTSTYQPPHLSEPELNSSNLFCHPPSLGRFLPAYVLVSPLLKILDSLLESVETCGRLSTCITPWMLPERKLQGGYLTWLGPGISPLLGWLNVEQPRSVISPPVRTHNIFFTYSFILTPSDPLPPVSNSVAQALLDVKISLWKTSRRTLSSSQSLGNFRPTSFYPLHPPPFAYPASSYVLYSYSLPFALASRSPLYLCS